MGLGLPSWSWLALAALPLAMSLIARLVRGATGTAINAMLGQTAIYQALLTLLLLGGFALSG
jgi:1,4-dihydroxy-2-naphthoate octaprenyltransferase